MLTDEQAKEVITSPSNSANISAARNNESALRVFTESLEKHEIERERYWGTLLATMESRSAKKYKRVKEFMRYPLPVVQLSESVLNEYFRVFSGKNRYFGYEANRKTPLLDEWKKKSDLSTWIQENAKEVLKNKPCSFVVVDIDENNQPYTILVDSNRLIDAEFSDKDGQLSYICFIHSIKNHTTSEGETLTYYAVYDDETYRVIENDSSTETFIEVSKRAHKLGYCPGHAFIKSTSNSVNPFKRKSAFDAAISKFEDYILFDCYRNYVDHYAPFPVTESPKNPCGNPECREGKVAREVIDQSHPRGVRIDWRDCDVCDGGKNNAGDNIMPGTHLAIKVNQDPKMNDGSGVFKMIFPDTDKLKYVPEKLAALETEIRYKTCGVNDMVTKEAINELQVKGSFSSMENVLLRVKNELDELYKWIFSTVGRLIYESLEIEVEANFGTEFYLITEDDLQLRYEKAKEIGLPSEEILNIYLQIIETKYRGNPAKLKRQKMLLDIDTLPMYSIEDCIKMKNESVIDDFDFSLKANIVKFINRFESENTPIIQFGLNIPYWDRINAIRDTLIRYNTDLIAEKNIRTKDYENILTQEQLDSQAKLRGSLDGIRGVIELKKAIADGFSDIESAKNTLVEIYGYTPEKAAAIIGTVKALEPKTTV